MAFERWDVAAALFPFTDVEVRKPRPIVVLSNGSFNRTHDHLVACMITTGAKSRWPSDHEIGDLAAAGLGHSSVVRWKVFTLPLGVIARRIGTLSESDRQPISARLAEIFVA